MEYDMPELAKKSMKVLMETMKQHKEVTHA
jgi:hypothetical protein